MDEQQAGGWNAGREERTESYNLSALFETKARTFCCPHGFRSLINPMCSCLGGVKSEGSCPLWPRGSADLCRAEDPRGLTALSHRIKCCICSVAQNSKYGAHYFPPKYTFKWSFVCIFRALVCSCSFWGGFTLRLKKLHSLPSKVLWRGVKIFNALQ